MQESQKKLFNKLMTIGCLCLVFFSGLSMLGSLVYERQNNAKSVREEISNQHVKAQEITTPFFQASMQKAVCKIDDSKKAKGAKNKKTKEISCTNYKKNMPIFAQSTNSKQNLEVTDSKYKRGIYGVTSYQGNISYQQTYDLSEFSEIIAKAEKEVKASNETLTKAMQKGKKSRKTTADTLAEEKKSALSSKINLLLPISDLRGVIDMPKVSINGKEYLAKYPVKNSISNANYLEVTIPNKEISQASTLELEVKLGLAGMKKINTIPLGEQFNLAMQTNWQSPNFVGEALPIDRQIDDNGFSATWKNQHLAISNSRALGNCIIENKSFCSAKLSSFDTEFAKPNDVYLQTERSLKYGLLLLVISFGSFFLFEVVKSLKIHPMQYLLVSMALLVFYVLLLSLAEQLLFWQAYAIAGTACAGLIGWYVSFVLHSVKRAGLFTGILAGQYAGFFTILTIEDLNLVIGAVLCFVLIAVVMFITRNIDWYEVK